MEFVNPELRLSDLRIQCIKICSESGAINVALEAAGSVEALEVLQIFINASWLGDLDSSYIDDLLHLPNETHGSVSLREEGWASLEDNGNWVRVSDSLGDGRCALVAWPEFKKVIQLKRQFLGLIREYKGRGIPRYNSVDGFRVRLQMN
jgi:hypothetical protein